MTIFFRILFALVVTWTSYSAADIIKACRGSLGASTFGCSLVGLIAGLVSLLAFSAGSLWFDHVWVLIAGPWLFAALFTGLRALLSTMRSAMYDWRDDHLFIVFLSFGLYLGVFSLVRLIALLVWR